MKKIFHTYHWIVFLLLSILCSCTNDVDNKILFLKQIVEVNIDGTSSTTVLTYNGNKISSIENNVKRSDFIYTGNLITKIEETDKVNNHLNTLQFSYTNNNLVKVTSSENYVMNYVHNADGTVSYEKLTIDTNKKEVKVNHGILYFQSSNLIKDEMILDDAGAQVLSKKTINLEYDYKNNALQNILGFNKLLNYNKSISVNNSILSTEEFDVRNLDTNQVISSISQYKSKYKYNSGNYPIEIVTEKLFLDNGASLTHFKTILHYD